MLNWKNLKNQVNTETQCNVSVDIKKSRKNLPILISKIKKEKKLKFVNFILVTLRFRKQWDYQLPFLLLSLTNFCKSLLSKVLNGSEKTLTLNS